MARKKYSKAGFNLLDDGLWLLLSVAGGVLFSFGLLNWFEDLALPAFVPVIVGAVITFALIVLRKYTTETAFAMKKKKG